MGIDIGGTLAKLAFALPYDGVSDPPLLPRKFGQTGAW